MSFSPEEGKFSLHYYENTFPIDPRSYKDILQLNKDALLSELDPESEASLEYQSILTALDHLPENYETDHDKIVERNREKEIIKRRIAAFSVKEPRVCEHIEHNIEIFNGIPGDPHSFDLIDALMEKQAYRLSFWRVATEEINYRRFFDVNNLAAIRVDQPRVFEETHRTIMRFLREGKLDGLRIDHVDGLRDPAGYFRQLQRSYFLETCRQRMDQLAKKLEDVDRTELEAALLERFKIGADC